MPDPGGSAPSLPPPRSVPRFRPGSYIEAGAREPAGRLGRSMRNKVVVHYLDGRLLKGVTLDFVPTRDAFHVSDHADERKVTKVSAGELKAIFFVKSFQGDPSYRPPIPAGDLQKAPGRKLCVTFRDGEVIYGSAAVYSPERTGFFLLPADPRDNNDRIFVFAHATTSIEAIKPSVAV